MDKIIQFLVRAFFVLVIATPAVATTIESTASNVGDRYTMEFTLANNTLSEDIDWFSIYFGQTDDGFNFTNVSEYSNFSPDEDENGSELQPVDWFSYSFEPIDIWDVPGQFNSDAGSTGISSGSTMGGFTVSFDWTGSGSIDDLFFEVGNINSSDEYIWLDDGYTSLVQSSSAVPEPGVISLFLAGLFGLRFFQKKTGAQKIFD